MVRNPDVLPPHRMPDAGCFTGIDRGVSDEQIERAIAEAELPALLVTIAHLTGDLGYIRDNLRPSVSVSAAGIPPQGGMDEEMQARARGAALEGLIRFRDGGGVPADVTDARAIRALFEYISGPIDDAYIPLMLHEFGAELPAEPAAWRLDETASTPREFSVAIIGAGMSGMATASRLTRAGVDVTIFECNDEVGGSWWQNRYPGCRLDTSNFAYSYSFAQKSDWVHNFSDRDEIFDYFRRMSYELGLRDRIRFGQTVDALEFDDADNRWTVVARGRDGSTTRPRFNAVVSAVGQLSHPNIPDVPGRESFGGLAFHTAEWPEGIDLTGKRVAVVGTGASAYQMIPEIAKTVGDLTILQRHAPWATPAPTYTNRLRDGQQWLYQALPHYHRWFRIFQFWNTLEARRPYGVVDPEWSDLSRSVGPRNDEVREALSESIARQFADRPDLAAHVVPDYPPYAKRTLRDNGGWARTLKSPHVRLVSDAISGVTERGILLETGEELEVDVIIWGTGFKASEFLTGIEVRGRGGVSLHDQWDGDARAYLGVCVPGFPNLFMVYGPNTGLLLTGSIILMSEMAAEYISATIRSLVELGIDAVDIRRGVYEDYNDWIDEGNRGMAWGAAEVGSWYKNKFGRVSANWPYTILEYWNRTRRPHLDDFELVGGTSRDAGKKGLNNDSRVPAP